MLPLFATKPSQLHRLVAVVGVAIVLLLGVLGVRPDWHEKLCHHKATTPACAEHHAHGAADHAPQAGDADACVISLFSHGHVLAALILVCLLLLRAVRACAFVLADFVAVPAPAYRLPHGCGPPLV